MRRRDLLKGGLLAGGMLPIAGNVDAGEQREKSGLVIDAHCHAGKGEAMTAPWTTFADPEVTLRRAEEAGIDRTVIFPIENPTYEQIARTAGTCRELQADETRRWTFVRVRGVKRTNNQAERALPHGVIYGRLSGGTDSESGSRFVERMLSVMATCRQEDIHVLGDQTRCSRAHLDGRPAPWL